MKATVDNELCIGCGLCAQTCPEVFQMSSDKVKVVVAVVPKNLEANCQEAADNCPVTAILIQK